MVTRSRLCKNLTQGVSAILFYSTGKIVLGLEEQRVWERVDARYLSKRKSKERRRKSCTLNLDTAPIILQGRLGN